MEQNDKFLKEFKNVISYRHKQNFINYQKKGEIINDKFAKSFGRYLRSLRSKNSLTQAQLAKKAGLSKTVILALENGAILSSEIKTEWLQALASVFTNNAEIFEDFHLLLNQDLPLFKDIDFYLQQMLHIENLSSKDYIVRQSAIEALETTAPLATPLLLESLRFEVKPVRLAVLELIREIGDENPIPILTNKLCVDDYHLNRAAVIIALKINDNNTLISIARALQYDNPNRSWVFIRLIVDLGSEKSLPCCFRSLRNLNEYECQTAIKIAMTIKDENSVAQLLDTLYDEDYHVRNAIVGLIVEIRDNDMILRLFQLTNKKKPILISSTEMRRNSRLFRKLQNENLRTLESFSKFTQNINSEDALSRLIKDLNNDMETLQRLLETSISTNDTIANRENLDLLKRTLCYEDIQTRNAALKLADRVGYRNTISLLIQSCINEIKSTVDAMSELNLLRTKYHENPDIRWATSILILGTSNEEVIEHFVSSLLDDYSTLFHLLKNVLKITKDITGSGITPYLLEVLCESKYLLKREGETILEPNHEKLMPCPHCGKPVDLAYCAILNEYQIKCSNTDCGILVTISSNEKVALIVERWNKRFPPKKETSEWRKLRHSRYRERDKNAYGDC